MRGGHLRDGGSAEPAIRIQFEGAVTRGFGAPGWLLPRGAPSVRVSWTGGSFELDQPQGRRMYCVARAASGEPFGFLDEPRNMHMKTARIM